MSCSCGGKSCGPIIVRPEIVLPDQSPGDITVDVTDHELEILCDAAGPFLRRYSVDPDGNVTTIDTELDGTSPHTVTGPVGVCGQQDESPGDESPAEECGTTVVVPLCDRTEESPGEPVTVQFLRRITFDCAGAIVGSEDLDVDGNPYTVVGEVGSCEPDVSSCGLPPDAVTSGETNSGVDGELQAVDTPPLLTGLHPSHVPLPGGGQSLWDGGSLVFPADPTGLGPQNQIYRNVAAILTAPRPQCDNGTAEVTVSVRVTNDGPDDGFAFNGDLRIYVDGNRIERIFIDYHAPVGHVQTLSATAIVPAAALESGDIIIELGVETFHTGPKQWTADQFVASYAYNVDGCAEEAPAMSVKLCSPVTVKYEPTPANDSGCSTTTVTLCDLGDESPGESPGEPTRFLRTYSMNCAGTVTSITDTDVDGQEYEPLGEVVICDGADEADVSTCGLPPDAVTSGETNSGVDGELQAVDTPPPLTGLHPSQVPLPGGGQALWDGGTLVFPADPSGLGPQNQIYRNVAAQLLAERPQCDDGTAEVTVSVRVTEDGPNPGFAYSGSLQLYVAGQRVERIFIDYHAPVGHVQTLTATAKVPAEALAAGDVVAEIGVETFHGGPKQWTADQFVATYAYSTDGCLEETPAMAVTLCSPITVKYEPPPVGDGSSGCSSTSLTLCDTVAAEGDPGELTATDTGPSPYFTDGCTVPLPGGAQPLWDGGTVAFPEEPDGSAGCGTTVWRNIAAALTSENAPCVSGETIPITVSVDVENTGPNDDTAGGPQGLLYSAPGEPPLVFDFVPPQVVGETTTLTLTADVPCDDFLAGTVAFYFGAKTWDDTSANPGPRSYEARNFTWSIDVEPGEGITQQFLRTYTFSCDGTVTGVSDTTLDGVDYDVLGEVTRCASDADAPVSTPVSTGITRLTGAATEDVAAVGVLQSATVTVISGEASVTTASGTATVPAGVTLTWSVTKDADEELDILSVTTGAGDDAIVHYTYR